MLQHEPFRLGLTGWPLGHSLSPRIHQAALRSLGLEGQYTLYPIHPGQERKASLTSLLEKLRSSELHGLNVTIPYKIEILDLVDRLSPAAEAVGAANTLFFREQQINGDNTDAAGFLADLQILFSHLFTARGKKTVLVLGSGGAARAAAFALFQHGWQVAIASRSIQRGQLLANRLNTSGTAEGVNVIQLSAASLTPFIQNHTLSLIVNATSVGMAPNSGESPWPEGVPFPQKVAVYDLVYSPPETCFVKTARRFGLQAHTGLGMLVEQAARAFEIWTGLKPSRDYLLEELHKEAASQ